MTTELEIFEPEGLNDAEVTELNKNIDAIIAAHKSNRQEINRLVLQSVSAMTESEDYERQLANKRGIRRIWGAISGSNKRLQDKINSSRAVAQYASQQTLQKIAEQNLMSFDLITAVNNKLNAFILAVEGEINQVYKILAAFFRQNRSDLIQIANRLERLEQNVNLLNWQNSIEYQMFGGVEYAELDDIAKLVCLARDFYEITKGEWTTSDLLLLKSAMAAIGLPPKQKINYLSFIFEVAGKPELKAYLLAQQDIMALPEADQLTLLSGIKKKGLLETDEHCEVRSVSALLLKNNIASVDDTEIERTLTEQYLIQGFGVDSNTEVECFDFIMELLFDLSQARSAEPIVYNMPEEETLEEEPQQASLPEGEEELKEKFKQAAELFKNCKLEEAEPLLVDLSDKGFVRANALLCWLYLDKYPTDDGKSNDAAIKGYIAEDTICSLQYAIYRSPGDDEEKRIYKKFMPRLREETESGDVFATYMLAICCMYDTDTPRDYSRTLTLLRDACSKGFYKAFWGMAILHMYGQGVDKNIDNALIWANKAAEFPQYIITLKRTADYLMNANKHEQALQWYLRFEEVGGKPYNQIGWIYINGKDIVTDLKKGIEYFQKAADSGDPVGQYNLAICYMYSKCRPFLEKSQEKVKYWFEKSAAQNYKYAKDAVQRGLWEYGYNFSDLKFS